MKCGHCQTYGVSVSHVRECASGRTIQAAVQAEPQPVTEAGYYQKDGSVYKVQIAVHGSGRPYAKRMVVDEPDCGGCANGEPCGAGCLPTRSWEYAPGVVKTLTAADRITAEQAKEFSDLYGCCVFCFKTLTDERSIFAGYGEKCASNHGLPWGEVAA